MLILKEQSDLGFFTTHGQKNNKSKFLAHDCRPHIIPVTYLKFFDHIARADPSADHSQALRASVSHLPRDWN